MKIKKTISNQLSKKDFKIFKGNFEQCTIIGNSHISKNNQILDEKEMQTALLKAAKKYTDAILARNTPNERIC